MQLYKINEAMNTILDFGFDETCIDPETGEVLPELAKARMDELVSLEGDTIEAIALSIKNENAEAAALKQEADALDKRQKTKKNKAEFLKRYLIDYLQAKGIPKYETPKCALSFRKSEQVAVTDQTLFMSYAQEHDGFLKYKDPEPSKTAIKTAIKNGQNIPGTEIVVNHNLQIK